MRTLTIDTNGDYHFVRPRVETLPEFKRGLSNHVYLAYFHERRKRALTGSHEHFQRRLDAVKRELVEHNHCCVGGLFGMQGVLETIFFLETNGWNDVYVRNTWALFYKTKFNCKCVRACFDRASSHFIKLK